MTRPCQSSVSQWLAVGLLTGGLAICASNFSAAQTASQPGRMEWDYRSVNVPMSTLQAELVRLGQDGWEVVTILHTDQSVTNAADGAAHLIAGNVEVVAKKAVLK